MFKGSAAWKATIRSIIHFKTILDRRAHTRRVKAEIDDTTIQIAPDVGRLDWLIPYSSVRQIGFHLVLQD